jgi:hypothetical protein
MFSQIFQVQDSLAPQIQGGSNTTGTNLYVNKCKQSWAYLNHLVYKCDLDISHFFFRRNDSDLLTSI